jgi:hypothetical protein
MEWNATGMFYWNNVCSQINVETLVGVVMGHGP